MARRISGPGRVTVSLRRSVATGGRRLSPRKGVAEGVISVGGRGGRCATPGERRLVGGKRLVGANLPAHDGMREYLAAMRSAVRARDVFPSTPLAGRFRPNKRIGL